MLNMISTIEANVEGYIHEVLHREYLNIVTDIQIESMDAIDTNPDYSWLALSPQPLSNELSTIDLNEFTIPTANTQHIDISPADHSSVQTNSVIIMQSGLGLPKTGLTTNMDVVLSSHNLAVDDKIPIIPNKYDKPMTKVLRVSDNFACYQG
jgi:hypothetical protein